MTTADRGLAESKQSPEQHGGRDELLLCREADMTAPASGFTRNGVAVVASAEAKARAKELIESHRNRSVPDAPSALLSEEVNLLRGALFQARFHLADLPNLRRMDHCMAKVDFDLHEYERSTGNVLLREDLSAWLMCFKTLLPVLEEASREVPLVPTRLAFAAPDLNKERARMAAQYDEHTHWLRARVAAFESAASATGSVTHARPGGEEEDTLADAFGALAAPQ